MRTKQGNFEKLLPAYLEMYVNGETKGAKTAALAELRRMARAADRDSTDASILRKFSAEVDWNSGGDACRDTFDRIAKDHGQTIAE